MSLRKKGAGRGVSLRRFSILMLFVSLVIMVILLVTTFRTVNAFHSLSAATSDYIEQAAAADNLMDASDYLTEEVQRYTVMGERTHLENYFREAEEDRRREQALAVMFKNAPNSPALTQLQAAMRESVDLMNREYYAMRLVLEASGDQDIPEAIRAVELTEEDRALSPEEKNAKARLLMHDSDYYAQKSRIRADMQECVDTLTENTHQVRQNMENRMGRCLTWMIILIVVQSVCVFKFLLLTNRLGVRPLLNAVNHIRRDEQLPVTGAQEFRYLADTYNKMYHTYKKNIESLSFKASHDGLTGVYNRAGYELIRESVDLATTALLILDVNFFKEINDTSGHETGDEALKKVGRVLTDNFRSVDYICRIGGDEFTVFMVNLKDKPEELIRRKVEQINEALADTSDGSPAVSMSVGIAVGDGEADSQELFRRADTALYYVKENGRNGCCFYEKGMKIKDR